jgi:hypothetical protein
LRNHYLNHPLMAKKYKLRVMPIPTPKATWANVPS